MAAASRRRVDGEFVERVIFSVVAHRRSVTPLSKLAGCSWVKRRAFVEGLVEVTDDACYRARDVRLADLAELPKTVLFSLANLLNLEVDPLFFDTSSTYFEIDRFEEVRVDDGTMRDRFVICFNPECAVRDAAVRFEILARVATGIAMSDALSSTKRAELFGARSTKPALERFWRRTASSELRIERVAISREEKLDGKFLLRTSNESLSAENVALGYQALDEVEQR